MLNYIFLTSFSVQDGDTALHVASGMGHKDTVEVLVQKGAQLDSKNNVSIMIIYFKVLGEKYIINTSYYGNNVFIILWPKTRNNELTNHIGLGQFPR